MQLPLLINHDPTHPIGHMRVDGARLLVTFTEDAKITKDMFFNMFSGAGARFHKLDHQPDSDDFYIREAEIFEWSLLGIKASA